MKSSVLVVDASFAIWLALRGPLSERIEGYWNSWYTSERQVIVPCLWLNEITSTIHKYFALKLIDEKEALGALDLLCSLDVQICNEDVELCRMAFHWASRLGQSAAYDSFYLALAERNEAEFWTADERLANRARQLGVQWVHWIGE